jgi:hypothetical protein
MYQNALLRIPITHKLGIDAIELKSMYSGMRSKADYNLASLKSYWNYISRYLEKVQLTRRLL